MKRRQQWISQILRALVMGFAALAACAGLSAQTPNTSGPVASPAPPVATSPGDRLATLGSNSRSLYERVAQLAQDYPCAAVALLKFVPARSDVQNTVRSVLQGMPTSRTVAAIREGSSQQTIDATLVPIWEGLYATGGPLLVSTTIVTYEIRPDTYESTVHCEEADAHGDRFSGAHLLEAAIRFTWHRHDHRLITLAGH